MSMTTGGRKVVAAAGTAEVLTATSSPCSWVLVIALTSNTSQVNVGQTAAGAVAAAGATERGVPLLAGDSTRFPVNDPSKLFVDARVSGEGVVFIPGTGA